MLILNFLKSENEKCKWFFLKKKTISAGEMVVMTMSRINIRMKTIMRVKMMMMMTMYY